MIAPLGPTSAHFAPGPAGPTGPAGPGGPCLPAGSCPRLKSRARSEKSFTWTVVTLFRGSRVTAYPVPARPTASARQATTKAGEGARRRMRRMRASLVAGLDVRRPSRRASHRTPTGRVRSGDQVYDHPGGGTPAADAEGCGGRPLVGRAPPPVAALRRPDDEADD